jgi:hypothetical protein
MASWAKIAALAAVAAVILTASGLTGQTMATAPIVDYWLEAPETWKFSDLTMPARTMWFSACFENRGQTDAWVTITITVWNATLLSEKGTPLGNPYVFPYRLEAKPGNPCWKFSITSTEGVASFAISYDMTKQMVFADQRQIISSLFGTLNRKAPTHLTYHQTSPDSYERSQAY